MKKIPRKPFHVRVLEKIARSSPTNEGMVAADLRVTVPSVKRVVDTFIRQGDLERVEVPGYPPQLELTRQGREYLRERQTPPARDARRSARTRRDVASSVDKGRRAAQRIDQILLGVQHIIGADVATPDVEEASPSLFQRATKTLGLVSRARNALKGK